MTTGLQALPSRDHQARIRICANIVSPPLGGTLFYFALLAMGMAQAVSIFSTKARTPQTRIVSTEGGRAVTTFGPR